MKYFDKPLNDLAFADIDDFCKRGIEEGIFVEYKEQFVSDLGKQIASFANTSGGLIIIGVKEGKDGKPEEWKGIDKVEDLSEKTNSILANVTPYPTSNFVIVDNPSAKNKCFVVITVEEGFDTPYLPVNKPSVYVRTGDITTPIDLARRDYLLTLLNKKDLAIAARASTINLVDKLHSNTRNLTISPADAEQRNIPLLSLDVLPFFPNQKITSSDQLMEKHLEWLHKSHGSASIVMETSVGGIVSTANPNRRSPQTLTQFYVGENGHAASRHEDGIVLIDQDSDDRGIFLQYCGYYLVSILRLGKLVSEHGSYNGSLIVRMRLNNMHSKTVISTNSILGARHRETTAVLPYYEIQKTITLDQINNLEAQINLSNEILEEFAKQFGLTSADFLHNATEYARIHGIR